MDVLLSILLSVALVVAEFIGLLLVKWAVALRVLDKRFDDVPIQAALSRADQGKEAMRDALAEAKAAIAAQLRRELVAGVVPGPELAFLSLTVQACLLLAWNYSDDAIRRSLSPWLFGLGNNAAPLLFVVVLITLIMWLALMGGREVLVSELFTAAAPKTRTVVMLVITAVGGTALAWCVFTLVASRMG